jgi:hypothetical protein
VLVQRAVLYLRAAAAREGPRVEAVVAEFEARGEPSAWDRDTRSVTEDGDRQRACQVARERRLPMGAAFPFRASI